MTSREINYLIAQIICIVLLLVWVVLLAIRLKRQTHSYWYIIQRILWYQDYEPWNWLKENLIYVDYLLQITALGSLTMGLIMQISDGTVFSKSPAFFVGTVLLSISACRILTDLGKPHSKEK